MNYQEYFQLQALSESESGFGSFSKAERNALDIEKISKRLGDLSDVAWSKMQAIGTRLKFGDVLYDPSDEALYGYAMISKSMEDTDAIRKRLPNSKYNGRNAWVKLNGTGKAGSLVDKPPAGAKSVKAAIIRDRMSVSYFSHEERKGEDEFLPQKPGGVIGIELR